MNTDRLLSSLTPERYTPRKLLRALRNPQLARAEVNRLGVRANQTFYRHCSSDGVKIPEREWDILIILDGCRYDLFAENLDEFVADSDEYRLKQVLSQGSHSREFLVENFGGGTHHDTVYVSANPFVFNQEDDVFHAVQNLLGEEWDSDLGTVPPEAVTSAGLDSLERYPNKRVIIHFMQPHFPFIGEQGRQLTHRRIHPDDVRDIHGDNANSEVKGTIIWDRLQHGEVSREEVWACYRENLQVVAPHVVDLLTAADGTAVVTADHGNLLGERLWPVPVRGYGHPQHVHVPALVKVPWLRVERSPGRNIVPEPPESMDSTSRATIEDRLAHLGYK